MDGQLIFDITRKELGALKDFSKVLREERDAIISFSLEGIIRENNRKEEILKRIEYLEGEKEKLLSGLPDQDSIFKSEKWMALYRELKQTMQEVNEALGKNMKLLSFSMDHVKSSIENIIGFVNKASYGRRQERISFFPSREI